MFYFSVGYDLDVFMKFIFELFYQHIIVRQSNGKGCTL